MKQALLKITLDRRIDGLLGKSIRRAFCKILPDNPLFSQHGQDGKTILRYPLIQYRSGKGNSINIIGFNEGADALCNIMGSLPSSLEFPIKEGFLQIGNIVGKTIQMSEVSDNAIGNYSYYKTLTPILLIDRKERENAYKNSTADEKAQLVRKWLVNNLVKTAYSLGLQLKDRVTIPILDLKEITVKKKGIEIIGFKGEFVTNMNIGDIGIGHFSSHGYGVVARQF
jgi:hypothetical protein